MKIANEKGLKEALRFLSEKGIAKEDISAFSKKFKNAELIPNEREIIKQNLEFFERELQLRVSLDSEKIPVDKKRFAMPGRPAIFVC